MFLVVQSSRCLHLTLLALAACMACGDPKTCAIDGESVGQLIGNLALSGDSSGVDMAKVAEFEWDRMYVFPAYTGAEDIEAATGLRYSADGFQNHVREGQDLIVFVSTGGLACYSEVWSEESSKARWAFSSSAYGSGGIPRQEARFRIDRSGRLSLLVRDK